MKRIALLTVLLLVVGLSLGFAQEFKPAFAWTTAGTASLTWGINLDNGENGFTNAGSAQFTLTLVPAATLTKGADAPVYGSITLTTTALTVTDAAAVAGGATAVSAKIVAKPLEIGINGAPTGALGKPTVIEHSDNNTDIVGILHTADAALATSWSLGSGTYVKFMSDMITVQGSVVSVGNQASNTSIPVHYAGGVDVSLVFKPITLGLGMWDGFATGDTPIVYATVATDAIGPLTLGAQLDLDLATTMAYDLGATVALAFTPKTSLSAAVNYGDNFGGLDLKVKFATTEVANLTETLTAFVLDLANAAVPALPMRLVVDNTLSYKVAMNDTQSITPSLQVQFGQTASTPAVSVLKAVAGVSVDVIPNTSIDLTYTSGDLQATTPVMGTVTVAATVSY